MEQTGSGKKLILAIIQEADYDMVVSALTEHSFYVTQLSSTGGFLKKRSVTLMIGVEEHRVQAALDILKQCAGRRQQMSYSNMSMSAGGPTTSIPMVPVPITAGGVTVFMMDLNDIQKF